MFTNYTVSANKQWLWNWQKTWHKELPGLFKTCLNNLVYYKWYENIDYIDMAIDIITAISQRQFLSNGNKRMAILLATVFLNQKNIYMLNSHSFWNKDNSYVKSWEKIMLETATRKKFSDDLKETKITLSDQEIYEKLRKKLL